MLRKMLRASIRLATVVGFATVAFAQAPSPLTGNDWRQLSDDARGMIATGYLLGFSEGLAYGSLIEHQASTKMLACLNGGVNGAQVRAVMDKDLRDHPETWNSPMLMKLAQALEAICPAAASNAAAPKSKK